MFEEDLRDALATLGNFLVIFLATAVSISTGFGFDFVMENPGRVLWTCTMPSLATALGWLKAKRGLGDVDVDADNNTG